MDKTIQDSIELLEDAIRCLKKGNRYNSKHPYETSFPNGARDHLRMLVEPVVRIDAVNDRDKAVDYLAYAGNYLSWLRRGCPKSEFADIASRYMNLFKIQESRIELQKMEEKLNCDRCCGSGVIQITAGAYTPCSECNGTGGQNCCDGAAPQEEQVNKVMEASK